MKLQRVTFSPTAVSRHIFAVGNKRRTSLNGDWWELLVRCLMIAYDLSKSDIVSSEPSALK